MAALKMTTVAWHPDLAKRSEVPPAGCRALASIQKEDLGQAKQEEHGTQHHHALFELHLRTEQPRPLPRSMLCVSPAAIPPHPWCMAPATPRLLPTHVSPSDEVLWRTGASLRSSSWTFNPCKQAVTWRERMKHERSMGGRREGRDEKKKWCVNNMLREYTIDFPASLARFPSGETMTQYCSTAKAGTM